MPMNGNFQPKNLPILLHQFKPTQTNSFEAKLSSVGHNGMISPFDVLNSWKGPFQTGISKRSNAHRSNSAGHRCGSETSHRITPRRSEFWRACAENHRAVFSWTSEQRTLFKKTGFLTAFFLGLPGKMPENFQNENPIRIWSLRFLVCRRLIKIPKRCRKKISLGCPNRWSTAESAKVKVKSIFTHIQPSGWFQPQKMLVTLDHFPRDEDKKTHLKPPPSNIHDNWCPVLKPKTMEVLWERLRSAWVTSL